MSTTNQTGTKPLDSMSLTIANVGERSGTDKPLDETLPRRWAQIDELVYASRILIVDDEQINIKAIEKHLSTAGFKHFDHLTDPRDVLHSLRETPPQLLILDIVMPYIHGLDLLRTIRRDETLHLLPVIILTAYSGRDTRREALESGATDFLTKPIEPHELRARVRNTLMMKVHQDLVSERAEALQDEVNQQAEALSRARRDAEMRYLAGKAEIAVEVLHNVGNALNSVNLGIGLVREKLSNSRLVALKKAVAMLEGESSRVADFLVNDVRGRVLPSYLAELSESLEMERSDLEHELELITGQLGHINAVLSSQQKHATLCNVVESISLSQLLGEVVDLLSGLIARTGARVHQVIPENETIFSDRNKLLQVLINLVQNGLQALEAGGAPDRRITVRVGEISEQRIRVTVEDNGIGIAPDDLGKVFAHGFTTRAEGHGIGLHSCANLTKELGGEIGVSSAGIGCGTIFSIELPRKLEG